jgi:hypothetical protein
VSSRPTYLVCEIAKILGRDRNVLRRQLIRVGWATQELPVKRSQWVVSSTVMKAHMPDVKKKLDFLRSARIKLHKRGQHPRPLPQFTDERDNLQNKGHRGEGEPTEGKQGRVSPK